FAVRLMAPSAAAAEPEGPRALEGRGGENLAAFTRLLGYVRHFHPSDEVAAVGDWDRPAVGGGPAAGAGGRPPAPPPAPGGSGPSLRRIDPRLPLRQARPVARGAGGATRGRCLRRDLGASRIRPDRHLEQTDERLQWTSRLREAQGWPAPGGGARPRRGLPR